MQRTKQTRLMPNASQLPPAITPEPQSLSPPVDDNDNASSLSSRAIVKVRTVARSTVITIPVEIRKGLDIIAGDRVLLTLEDHSLKVTKE